MTPGSSPAETRKREPFRTPEILFVAAAAAAGCWARGRWLDPVGDPGFSWSLAYRLSHGERPYRDVYSPYGPLSPYLLALWGRLFTLSSFSFLLVNWLAAVVAGLLLLRCARPFLTHFELAAMAGLILATSLLVPGAGRLVMPYYPGAVHAFIFSLAALLLLSSEKTSSGRAALAGAMTGLALCCKQEVGAAALAAILAACFAGVRRPFVRAASALAGFAAIAIAAWAFALWCAPLDWLRERNHLWPFNPRPPAAFDALFHSVSGFADPGWFAGLRASLWTLLAGVTLFAALGGLLARELSGRAWRRIFGLVAALLAWWAFERFPLVSPTSPARLSVLVSGLVALLALFSPPKRGRPLLLSLAVFAAATGMRAVVSPFESGPYDGPAHFAAAASWAILLLAFVPRLLWDGSPRACARARGLVAAALFLFGWWNAYAGAAALRFPWKERVSTPIGPVYVERGQAALFREIGRRLNPRTPVLVLPEINAVDALFRARSVSPLPHLVPGWLDAARETELILRFEKDPPEVVVLFNRPTSEFGAVSFGEGYGMALSDWCRRNYRVDWSSARGAILLRKNPAPVAPAALGDGP